MVSVKVMCLLAFLALTKSEKVQTRPENEVLLLGQQFVWPCRIFNNRYPSNVYNNPVTWMNEKYGIDQIFSGTRILRRLEDVYDVDEEATDEFKRVDLRFKNVSYDVTDIYHCVRGHSVRYGYSANIIVVDPRSVNCDIFPLNFGKGNFVSVKRGDSMKITCNVEYQTYKNCYAEALWQGSEGHDLMNYEAKFNNRSFTAHVNIDDNFVNASKYNFSVKFKCLSTPKTQADYSRAEPIFYANFATPTFYLKDETPLPDPALPLPATILPAFTVHSSASETDPEDNENPPMNMVIIFVGILVFFVIVVVILVILFVVKYKKRASDETLTMFTEGQSMMTENVAYKRQPVSCENSYNMHQVNLTPPPQASMAYQGIISPPAPHSAVPLLHHGLQHYHPAVVFPQKSSAEDSEVYDRIDDNGIISSIYLESTKKPPPSFTAISSSCSSQLANLPPGIIGYIPMTQSRLPSGYHIPSIPSSPSIFHHDQGVYLIPQDSTKESQAPNNDQ